jgi:endonuclease-3
MNEIGWVTSKEPEGTRVQLEAWLPKEHWPNVNVDFVGFGQMIQQVRRLAAFSYIVYS